MKDIFRHSCLDKYGVEHPMQNINIFEKGQKTKFLRHKFKDTNIWYQGSYELDFLEKYFDKYPDIERGPTIKYKLNGKNKIYFPDFYIPSKNVVVECKNSYLFNKHKDIIQIQEISTIDSGFNFIIIIDKNYSVLEKLKFL